MNVNWLSASVKHFGVWFSYIKPSCCFLHGCVAAMSPVQVGKAWVCAVAEVRKREEEMEGGQREQGGGRLEGGGREGGF